MINKKHIIKRFEFHLEAKERQQPLELRKEVKELLHGDFKEDLEVILDNNDVGNDIIRIDRLEVDLGEVNRADLKEKLLDRLKFEIREGVIKVRTESMIHKALITKEKRRESSSEDVSGKKFEGFSKTLVDREYDVVFFYLENGAFPWWSTLKNTNEVKELLASGIESRNTALIRKLQLLLNDKNYIVKRLVSLLDTKELYELFQLLTNNQFDKLNRLVKTLDLLWGISNQLDIRSSSKQEILKVFTFASNNSLSNTYVVNGKSLIQVVDAFVLYKKDQFGSKQVASWLKKIKRLNLKQNLIQLREVEKELTQLNLGITTTKFISAILNCTESYKLDSKSNPELTLDADNQLIINKSTLTNERSIKETIRVGYCGVVLVWPMLKPLFEDRKLIKNGEFISVKEQLKAIQMLNYLVSGKDKIDEHQMVMNKIFCGLSPEYPINSLPELTDSDKEEVTNLLEHVIKHWSVLKNTSIEGLRVSFLDRLGQLEETNECWSIKVEQRSIDILLRKIPWGYSMIKLGWMPKIIMVEW